MSIGQSVVTFGLNVALMLNGQGEFVQCRVLDTDIQGEYTGECKKGLAEGYGVSIGEDKYEGHFRKGELSGKGKYTWSNGDVYQGNFRHGKMNGQGKYTWENGSVYLGNYKNHAKNGYGKLTLVKDDDSMESIESWATEHKGHWQGDVYVIQGIFEDDDLAIPCSSPKECKTKQKLYPKTYITSTDSHCKIHNPYPQPNETITWDGDCVDGFASGKGMVKWYENGKQTAVDIGNFRYGKQYGVGKSTWANGSTYLGNWKNDKKHGFGTITLVKGDEGIESWKESNKGHWKGKYYIVQGIFEDDYLAIECSSTKACKNQQKK